MTGLIVIIICIVISVFCYKRIANSCRNKGRGSIRTFLTALISSFFLFIITMGIGVANFPSSKDKVSKSANQGETITKSSANEENKSIYICNKFDTITQTRQGTKYNSGFYSDKKTHITYAITDDKLTTKMSIPGFADSTETATFIKLQMMAHENMEIHLVTSSYLY